MHVKWSKTESTGRLVASLSEGRRVDGETWQQHIGMLATLRQADPRRPTAAERAAFWPGQSGEKGSDKPIKC